MIVGFTSIPMVAVMVIITMTATIGRHKSYYHTIITMTATIGRSKSFYHTIMTMTATIGIEVNPTVIQS
jgi:disulfide bond formation protein DsbB